MRQCPGLSGSHAPREEKSHDFVQEGTGLIRFVPVPDFSNNHRFGSVRYGSVRFGSARTKCCFFWFDAVRPALFERVMVRSGSVRFVSASGSGRFQNQTVRFCAVRPVRFGFLFLPLCS